ncbi:aspartate carbamoyltransferase catalytic subunit [candidate division KSB1 bacterium]|nr:aspartate carbamoyltransferase catalytic subunit [candidate division KSB1 bacterium]MBL7095300.1 aspartate carbamoyltransferase catalytic subunit [candidate division KSB1 bacterium]
MQENRKHLLGLEGVPAEEIKLILDTAESFKEVLDRPIPKVPTLRGKTIVNLFFEASTRTRFSFELAEKRLSADTLNFSTTASSVKKGETLRDTAQNIEAMKVDMVVIRHPASGAPHFLRHWIKGSVINAGDGCHEHPTQALLDMKTIQGIHNEFKGLRVAIVGDIIHSRVARSNIYGLTTMGAEVALCAPAPLIPYEAEKWNLKTFYNVDDAIAWADVLMVLRIQLERQSQNFFPTLREYHNYFGITRERLEKANKKITLMHPGPINRGIELDSDLADDPEYSVILDQVTNGVAIRMAILYLLSGETK